MLGNIGIATIYIDPCIALFIFTLKATRQITCEKIFIMCVSVRNNAEACVSHIMHETQQVFECEYHFFECSITHGCTSLLITEVAIYSYWVLFTICFILVLFHFVFYFIVITRNEKKSLLQEIDAHVVHKIRNPIYMVISASVIT